MLYLDVFCMVEVCCTQTGKQVKLHTLQKTHWAQKLSFVLWDKLVVSNVICNLYLWTLLLSLHQTRRSLWVSVLVQSIYICTEIALLCSCQWKARCFSWGSWSQCWAWLSDRPRTCPLQSRPPHQYWPSPLLASHPPRPGVRRKIQVPVHNNVTSLHLKCFLSFAQNTWTLRTTNLTSERPGLRTPLCGQSRPVLHPNANG